MRKDYSLAFDDNYTTFAAVTISSVISNAHEEDELHFHLLVDNISDKNKYYLQGLGNAYFHFYYPDLSQYDFLRTNAEWSIQAWYRIFLPSLLGDDVHRVLYLDCDVIVCDSLDDLFQLSLEDISVAGCEDIQSRDKSTYKRLGYDENYGYICSGVLMMNLDFWREKGITDNILNLAKKKVLKFSRPRCD